MLKDGKNTAPNMKIKKNERRYNTFMMNNISLFKPTTAAQSIFGLVDEGWVFVVSFKLNFAVRLMRDAYNVEHSIIIHVCA